MHLVNNPIKLREGFSLIEVSLVIALIISLSAFVDISVSAVQNWQLGKNASLSLQAVYSAQRSYMADHPTSDISSITATQLQSYLPQGWSSMPVFVGTKNEQLTLNYTVMPPRLLNGNNVYDPSGKSDDGLWDLGK